MDSVSGVAASAVTSSALRASAENLGVSAVLLKKAANADKEMVKELLPDPPHNGRLNLSA